MQSTTILVVDDEPPILDLIASYLRAHGLVANDRVALLAENSIEHLACYFGVMAYGATVCTVHVEMNRHHFERILPAINPRVYRFPSADNALKGLNPNDYWNNVCVRSGDLRPEGVFLGGCIIAFTHLADSF